MKRLMVLIVLAVLFNNIPLLASSNNVKISTQIEKESSSDTGKRSILINRLKEISTIDKSKLSFAQKRELRKETRDINHKLKQEGIFLTLGLLGVIAILLLIILKPL